MTVTDMPTYSKTLHPDDFRALEPEIDRLRGLIGLAADFPHEARLWEYGLALRCLEHSQTRFVLDVGGGGGLFSPAAAREGAMVTQIDPKDFTAAVGRQEHAVHSSIRFARSDLESWGEGPYDLVACLSVIEHVPKDLPFLGRLMDKVDRWGYLVLTTDFHPSGLPQVDGHLRTYTEGTLKVLAGQAAEQGFAPWPAKPDWSYFGEHVYHYSFASLVLRRTE